MDGNVLDEVLALEQQLRLRRQQVEARQAQRLALLQQELARQLAADEERQATERAAYLAKAQSAAQAEAAALLETAQRYVARLDTFDEALLRERLWSCLPGLLPGRSDDRADGTG